MATFMPNAGQIERKWYVLDAAGKPVGRVAATAAHLLRGKHKPAFTPHVDCGDHVIVINCDKAIFTGNKLEQKIYYHHTGYIGNLKSINAKTLMAKKPQEIMRKAVKGMIPDTVLGRKELTRLRLFAGPEHTHQAQTPEAWNS